MGRTQNSPWSKQPRYESWFDKIQENYLIIIITRYPSGMGKSVYEGLPGHPTKAGFMKCKIIDSQQFIRHCHITKFIKIQSNVFIISHLKKQLREQFVWVEKYRIDPDRNQLRGSGMFLLYSFIPQHLEQVACWELKVDLIHYPPWMTMNPVTWQIRSSAAHDQFTWT